MTLAGGMHSRKRSGAHPNSSVLQSVSYPNPQPLGFDSMKRLGSMNVEFMVLVTQLGLSSCLCSLRGAY